MAVSLRSHRTTLGKMPHLLESVNSIVNVFYKHARWHRGAHTLNRSAMKWLIMEEFTEVIKVSRSQPGRRAAKGRGGTRTEVQLADQGWGQEVGAAGAKQELLEMGHQI